MSDPFPAFSAQLRRLVGGDSLEEGETTAIIGAMLDGAISPPRIGAWLTAHAAKGVTTAELVGAARAMRSRAIRVTTLRTPLLDVCGTGGDGAGTINISTAVAFVVAACGVAVAKHGNRSVSSRCGSADVLEELGVPINLSPDEARRRLEGGSVAFLFAQQYHPALKNLAPIRRELGIRTIFNLLGPLTNPAAATRQLIGVSDVEAMEVIADAARELGVEAGAVVHADNGLDEIAGDCPTTMLRWSSRETKMMTLDPGAYGISAPSEFLIGGDAAENAEALFAILTGEPSARADVVALNAAVALEIAGVVPTIEAGLARAEGVLQDGRALAVLEELRRSARQPIRPQ